MLNKFLEEKTRILNAPDLSPKGSWDEPILHILNFINSLEYYVTTSSCSGRVAVFSNVYPKSENGKKHKCCTMLYKDHDFCSIDLVKQALENTEYENVYIKYEGLIIHIQCSSLEQAKKMLNCGMDSALRNSGIIPCGIDNSKYIIVLKGNLVIETPLKIGGKILASDEDI